MRESCIFFVSALKARHLVCSPTEIAGELLALPVRLRRLRI
jgi:hypothetical protein